MILRLAVLIVLMSGFGAMVCGAQRIAVKDDAADTLAEAKAKLDRGQFADAEKLLRGQLTERPSEAEAHYLLAYALFRENKPADSLKEYTKAARQRTPSATELKTVALDYLLLNDFRDAEHWA